MRRNEQQRYRATARATKLDLDIRTTISTAQSSLGASHPAPARTKAKVVCSRVGFLREFVFSESQGHLLSGLGPVQGV